MEIMCGEIWYTCTKCDKKLVGSIRDSKIFDGTCGIIGGIVKYQPDV